MASRRPSGPCSSNWKVPELYPDAQHPNNYVECIFSCRRIKEKHTWHMNMYNVCICMIRLWGTATTAATSHPAEKVNFNDNNNKKPKIEPGIERTCEVLGTIRLIWVCSECAAVSRPNFRSCPGENTSISSVEDNYRLHRICGCQMWCVPIERWDKYIWYSESRRQETLTHCSSIEILYDMRQFACAIWVLNLRSTDDEAVPLKDNFSFSSPSFLYVFLFSFFLYFFSFTVCLRRKT